MKKRENIAMLITISDIKDLSLKGFLGMISLLDKDFIYWVELRIYPEGNHTQICQDVYVGDDSELYNPKKELFYTDTSNVINSSIFGFTGDIDSEKCFHLLPPDFGYAPYSQEDVRIFKEDSNYIVSESFLYCYTVGNILDSPRDDQYLLLIRRGIVD